MQRRRHTLHRPRHQERRPTKPAVCRVSSFGGPIDIKAEAAVARRLRPELNPPRETQRTLPICITLAINFAKGKQQNKTKQKHVSSTGDCGAGQGKSRFFFVRLCAMRVQLKSTSCLRYVLCQVTTSPVQQQ